MLWKILLEEKPFANQLRLLITLPTITSGTLIPQSYTYSPAIIRWWVLSSDLTARSFLIYQNHSTTAARLDRIFIIQTSSTNFISHEGLITYQQLDICISLYGQMRTPETSSQKVRPTHQNAVPPNLVVPVTVKPCVQRKTTLFQSGTVWNLYVCDLEDVNFSTYCINSRCF